MSIRLQTKPSPTCDFNRYKIETRQKNPFVFKQWLSILYTLIETWVQPNDMYCSKQYKIIERQSYFSNIYLTIKFYALVKALKWKVSTTYWINGTVSNYIYHWYFDKKKQKTKKKLAWTSV